MTDSLPPVRGFSVATRAAVLRSTTEPITIETIWLKDVGPGEARVRIDATGVCHSDLSLARGKLAQPLPAVLGHEASGTIVELAPDVEGLSVGQRVVILWLTPCGECFHCAHGEPQLCVHASDRSTQPYAVGGDGEPIYPGLTVASFAEQTVVAAASLIPVPDEVPSDLAALIGCAVSTGVGAVTKVARVREGSSVLVIGLGGVGLSAIMGAKLSSAATVIATDRALDKAEYALAAGATEFLPADGSLRAAVRELTGGRGADYVFDCVGSAATIRTSWGAARRGGTVCVVGIGGKDEGVEFSALELFHFARTLIGCVGGSLDAPADLPRYFGWVRDGALPVAQLVTRAAGLEDVESAFADLQAGVGVRTVLHPNPSEG